MMISHAGEFPRCVEHARFVEGRDAYSLAREVIAVPVYLLGADGGSRRIGA